MALSPEVVAKRIEIIRTLKAQGKTQRDIAEHIGISHVGVCLFLKVYGKDISFPKGRRRIHALPEQTVMVDRKTGEVSPMRISEEAVARTIAILGCTRERALFVLSCPISGRANGWRGGNAIG